MACNAGILTRDINPGPGRYMAKVTIDVEKGGVDNTIKEFISLGEVGVTDYTPQAYYVLVGDVYTEKSCDELLTLGEAGKTECYRYVHHIDEHEFKRMFSNSDSGFYVEHFGVYTFCDASETSLLAGLIDSTEERTMKGAKGFYVVARKIPT